jgi:hypothetical protein
MGIHGEFPKLNESQLKRHKKTAGSAGGFSEIKTFLSDTLRTLYRQQRLRTRSNQNKNKQNSCV